MFLSQLPAVLFRPSLKFATLPTVLSDGLRFSHRSMIAAPLRNLQNHLLHFKWHNLISEHVSRRGAGSCVQSFNGK